MYFCGRDIKCREGNAFCGVMGDGHLPRTQVYKGSGHALALLGRSGHKRPKKQGVSAGVLTRHQNPYIPVCTKCPSPITLTERLGFSGVISGTNMHAEGGNRSFAPVSFFLCMWCGSALPSPSLARYALPFPMPGVARLRLCLTGLASLCLRCALNELGSALPNLRWHK